MTFRSKVKKVGDLFLLNYKFLLNIDALTQLISTIQNNFLDKKAITVPYAALILYVVVICSERPLNFDNTV